MLNAIHVPIEEAKFLSSSDLNQGFEKLFHLHTPFPMRVARYSYTRLWVTLVLGAMAQQGASDFSIPPDCTKLPRGCNAEFRTLTCHSPKTALPKFQWNRVLGIQRMTYVKKKKPTLSHKRHLGQPGNLFWLYVSSWFWDLGFFGVFVLLAERPEAVIGKYPFPGTVVLST